jgi:hypothetical protein
MRREDAPDVGAQHQKQRLEQTLLGLILSLAGLALLIWLPSERESVRLGVGGLVILLGGMMVNKDIVTAWWGLFGRLIPWAKKGNE